MIKIVFTQGLSEKEATEQAKIIFTKLDKNNAGGLAEEEFVTVRDFFFNVSILFVAGLSR